VGSFYVGLDLGQAQDYTAIAVAEWLSAEGKDEYHVRHLQRFRLGMSYPDMVAEVARMMHSHPLDRRAALVVDQTGVGRPVVELLTAAGLGCVPVTITGGDAVTCENGAYRVPKRELVSTLQVVLQGGRLKFAEGLPEVATLVRELLAFQVKITAAANATFGAWREGSHDDLVLAVALATWYGERFAVRGKLFW
jgi:hypothetical protein